MRESLLLLLLLAGCVNREYRFERLDGDQPIEMPLKLEGLYGLRDGALVNAEGRFADGPDVVTMNFSVNLGPPPQFRSGTYEAIIGGKRSAGSVDCPSLSYFGDQSASPTVGGLFVLKDENNRPAYRVRIPAATLQRRSIGEKSKSD
jgi:hypothetical protein